MELNDMTFAQLRELAKKHKINTWGKGKDDIRSLLEAAEVKPAVKKGKSSWRPSRMLDLKGQKPGFRYRFCDKDQANLEKKEAEGWVYATRETGHGELSHSDPELVHGGNPPDSAVSYRDLVVMALPEEIAQQRDEYYREFNEAQLQQVHDQAKEKLAGIGAPVHEGSELTRIK